MAQEQTDAQKVRSALVELAGSEQAMAVFELEQMHSVDYWQFMIQEYKKARGLTEAAPAAEVTKAAADTVKAADKVEEGESQAAGGSAKRRGTIGQPSPASQSNHTPTTQARHN